jgi:lipopolysaccharide transport system ATP-binding protein
MAKHAITIEGISKRYRLGQKQRNASTFREAALATLTAPLRRFKSLSEGADGQAAGEDAFWALRDINFNVDKGEVIGLIGRNGAGKSTLLKVLSRIVEPTSGTVRMRGRCASLLEVGTGFHPELSGRENIFLNGAILGMKRAEILKNFDAIVEFAEVEKFLDTPVKYYSSGMYVRLAFAVAAHLEPEILIVDEVLAVGDAAFQKKCMGRMGSVAREGRTILFVSHNMGAIETMCTKAFWLEKGQVKKAGNSHEVVQQYLAETMRPAALDMNLDEVPRTGTWGQQLKITRAEWLSGLPLKHGGSVHMRVQFEARSAVEDCSIGLGFNSMEGPRLLTFESDFGLDRRRFEKGRTYEVDVRIDSLPLPPGTYSFNLGARSGDTFSVDYIEDCGQIEVTGGALTQPHHYVAGAGVRLLSDWNWSERSTSGNGSGNGQPRRALEGVNGHSR